MTVDKKAYQEEATLTMTFDQIIQKIRNTSPNAKDAGTRFETLIQRWFLATPLYQVQKAWLWADFAKAIGEKAIDLGIDLVLKMGIDEFWAVQCKFYNNGSHVNEEDVSNFLGYQGKEFTLNNQTHSFSRFVWIDTDAVWSKNANDYVQGRENFTRISKDFLRASNVDWDAIIRGEETRSKPKQLRDYQKEVLHKAEAHFKNNERGKIIMACGTGKTLTSQRIAEAVAGTQGSLILYCVPSIALLGQTYQSWAENAQKSPEDTKPASLFAIGVCSDNHALEKKAQNGDFIAENLIDSPLPATTAFTSVKDRILAAAQMQKEGMTVVFTTYQSLQVVANAQQAVLAETGGSFGVFDMVICDEAHRTTGAAKAGLESSFMKIHDNDFIKAQKRLYMTATPRIYTTNAKADASKMATDAVICSMDDVATYGEEIARISFGQAVNLGCLSDYKVIILTVDPKDLPDKVIASFESNDKLLDLPTATRLVGAIHGLSKQLVGDDGRTLAEDPKPCTRALVFTSEIGNIEKLGSSKNIAAMFPEVSSLYLQAKETAEERQKYVSIECKHVDGTMNTSERNAILTWLAGENSSDDNSTVCRVVSNVRCLSEGVDVPALDAVIFMAPKKSQIDIVQSVGRVMRNFRRGEEGGKKYGYIILPVALRPGENINEALEESNRFKEVWNVLCALRSHDENFNAQVNAIRLSIDDSSSYTPKAGKIDVNSGKFIVGTIGDQKNPIDDNGENLLMSDEQKAKIRIAHQLELFEPEQQKIFAKLVDKVGTRNYWETWASDVGKVTLDILAHMKMIIERHTDVQKEFNHFIKSLRENINESIDETQAEEMLGQHIVIGPIFDALFANYHFNENNAVSITLSKMVNLLKEHGLEKETTVLKTFYASIKNQIGSVNSPKAKQQLIKDLYNRFFAVAFKKTTDRLGIVYTPVECVDFIIKSVEHLLQKEFGRSLSDENVHILDPFVGTGTFITRLLQLGIIRDKDLLRKYQKEIHCNEIVLLAYYVADVNIETVFNSMRSHLPGDYVTYNNICLTDTFQLAERQRTLNDLMMRENSEQIERQRNAPIQVIIGNPPYSVGQKSGNDNNQNLKYPKLDKRIAETYAAGSTATNKNAMYDSYIRAFRWAADRISNERGGIIGFVTNGGWIEGNAAAGMRKSLCNEFDSIHVFDLRGDQRTQGEMSRKEGGKIFGSGSRAKVCMTFLVKHPNKEKHDGKIYYHDIGDYLTREAKLKILEDNVSIASKDLTWQQLTPDEHGDWLNKRLGGAYDNYIRIGDKKDKAGEVDKVFGDCYSRGLATSRDVWCYNYSEKRIKKNIAGCIDFYNQQRELYANGAITEIPRDPAKISWARGLEQLFVKNHTINEDDGCYVNSMYRPFIKSKCYYAKDLNEMIYQIPKIYPFAVMQTHPQHEVNRVISVSGPSGKKDFACLMVNQLPCLDMIEKGQCFPLYVYGTDEKPQKAQGDLFDQEAKDLDLESSRKSGITNWMLKQTRGKYGHDEITQEDIFYYVYGLLHCQSYRDKYQNDFKKALPKIPFVEKYEDFQAFSKAGRELGDLHCNYESVPMNTTAQIVEDGSGDYTLSKLKPAGKGNFTELQYNSHVKITNIPAEAHEYIVNGRSPLGWMIDQYQVYIDKDSGIKNDPNEWCQEHDNPRYILELILRLIEVSVRTMEIVKNLPKVEV